MNAKALGLQLINTFADVAGGATGGAAIGTAVTLAAGSVIAGGPVLWTAVVGVCVASMLTQAVLQAKGDDAQKQGEGLLCSVIQEQGTLRKALQKISAEQDAYQIFDGQKLDALLAMMENQAEVDAKQEELLVYIGDWLGQWCDRYGLRIDDVKSILEHELPRLSKAVEAVHVAQSQLLERAESNHAQQMGTMEEIARGIGEIRRDRAVDRGAIHAELDAVRELIRQRSYDIAEDRLVRLRASHWPTLGETERFRVLVGEAMVRERRDEDFKAAAKLYLQAADTFPNHEDAESYKAIAYLQLGRGQDAAEAAKKAIETSRSSPLAWSIWVRSRPEGPTPQELLKTIPEYLHDDAEVKYALAVRAMSFGDYGWTEATLRQALEVMPDSRAIAGDLGLVVLEQERLDVMARSSGEDAVVRHPERLREAVALLTRAIDAYEDGGPSSRSAHLRVGRYIAKRLLGEQLDAEGDIMAAHSAAPGNMTALLHKAIILHEQDRTDAAIDSLRNAPAETLTPQLRAYPNNPAQR